MKLYLITLLILSSINLKAQPNIKADTIRANVIITSSIISSGIIPRLDSLPDINWTIRDILNDRRGFYLHHRIEGSCGVVWIDNDTGTISYNVITYNESFKVESFYFVYRPYNNKVLWSGPVKLNKDNMKMLRDLYNLFHP